MYCSSLDELVMYTLREGFKSAKDQTIYRLRVDIGFSEKYIESRISHAARLVILLDEVQSRLTSLRNNSKLKLNNRRFKRTVQRGGP